MLSCAAPGAAAEHIAEGVAEDLGEDVIDVGEALALAPESAASAVDAGMAEPVIGGAFLVV